MSDRKAHPSGRPKPANGKKSNGWRRPPPDGPLTPRLQQGRDRTAAIGFMQGPLDYYEGAWAGNPEAERGRA